MGGSRQLDGKVAIVTGAAAGLGRSICDAFVEAGAAIVIADLDEAAGSRAALDLGGQARFQRTDVTSEGDLKSCIDACLDSFGRLDCMVNNAGVVGPWGPITEIDPDGVEQMFRVNVFGPLLGIKHAAPVLTASGGGSIINISGTAGESVRGSALQIGYNLSKAAVNQLTRCSAYELGPSNIRVNAIAPGFMAAPVLPKKFGLSDEETEAALPGLRAFFKTLQPLSVTGEPEDIARMAVFLASDDSRFVTGQIHTVDGGMMLDFAGLSTDEWLAGVSRALGVDSDTPPP